MKKLEDQVLELRESFSLSDYEALRVIVELQKIELYKQAQVLSSDNRYPGALEKIAMGVEDLVKAKQ